MRVSVIIPTLNAERYLKNLLSSLENQSLLPHEIILIDSSSSDRTTAIAKHYHGVRIMSIPLNSFNHGGTRDLAAREAIGDILLYLTQDAVPAKKDLIETLCKALVSNTSAAAAYARQIPREDASLQERFIREFSYPGESSAHDQSSIRILGLRAFYLSNVCAAYKKDIYFSLGGFEDNLRSNEDMLFAAKAIRTGYQILYEAKAEVIHSHNLSLKEQYMRNRLQGYELARHRDLLGNNSPVGSGGEMFRYVSRNLLKQGHLFGECQFILDCAARYLGNRAGKWTYEKER